MCSHIILVWPCLQMIAYELKKKVWIKNWALGQSWLMFSEMINYWKTTALCFTWSKATMRSRKWRMFSEPGSTNIWKKPSWFKRADSQCAQNSDLKIIHKGSFQWEMFKVAWPSLLPYYGLEKRLESGTVMLV